MTNLVSLNGGQAVVTSLAISQIFGRQHDKVLGSLRGLIQEGHLCKTDFGFTSHEVQMPNGGFREERFIELNKRGALIAMPFIGGEKCKEGQIKLVDEFLRLESAAPVNRLAPALPQMTEADQRREMDVLRAENSRLMEDLRAAKAEIVKLKDRVMSLLTENGELLRYKISVLDVYGPRPQKPVTSADRAEILRLFDEGNNAYRISKLTQRSQRVVARVLKNAQSELPLGGAS